MGDELATGAMWGCPMCARCVCVCVCVEGPDRSHVVRLCNFAIQHTPKSRDRVWGKLCVDRSKGLLTRLSLSLSVTADSLKFPMTKFAP